MPTVFECVCAFIWQIVNIRFEQADQRRGTFEQLILPSSLLLDVPREVRDYISSCERCTVVPCFRKKGMGYDAWYVRSAMPCVCMLMVCLKGP